MEQLKALRDYIMLNKRPVLIGCVIGLLIAMVF